MLYDINGELIGEGVKLIDNVGFDYLVVNENGNLYASSLREKNKKYELYQERINRNGFYIK